MSKKVGTSVIKKFTYEDKTLVVYNNNSVSLVGANRQGKYIGSISYKEISKTYKEIFGDTFPSLEAWIDMNGESKIYEYFTFNYGVTDNKAITVEHPGYDIIGMHNEQMDELIESVKDLVDCFKDKNEIEDTQEDYKQESEPYSTDNFNKDIFGKVSYKKDIEPLLYNKNSILALTGSVGTGKSTIAKHIGWAIVRYKESYRMEMINFNASLDYCDLYIGTKPMPGKPGALEERSGAIKQLCDRAIAEPKKEFVLIMDEFNRGNINNIGGPLISCLADRGTPYKLDSKHELCIPENVQVIITMNTSDQSISSLDRALLDRMNPIDLNEGKFRELFKPTYEDLVPLKLFNENQRTELKRLIELVDILNDILEKDETFGSDNRISFRPIMNYVNSNNHNLDQSLNQIKLTLKYLRWSIEEHIYRDAVAKFSDYIQKYMSQ